MYRIQCITLDNCVLVVQGAPTRLFHLCEHTCKGIRSFQRCDGMVEVGRRGRKGLFATGTGRPFCESGNPLFAMSAGKVYEHIGLCFSRRLATRVCTGKGYTRIRILLLGCIRRMRLGHMLEIRGLLDKLLIRAMGARELIVLNMLRLHMVIHRILFCRLLLTILTLEHTIVNFYIIGFRSSS